MTDAVAASLVAVIGVYSLCELLSISLQNAVGIKGGSSTGTSSQAAPSTGMPPRTAGACDVAISGPVSKLASNCACLHSEPGSPSPPTASPPDGSPSTTRAQQGLVMKQPHTNVLNPMVHRAQRPPSPSESESSAASELSALSSASAKSGTSGM